MDYKDKAFTMGDGTRLLVVEQVDFEDRTYLLVVNRNNEQDLRFVELCGEYLNDIDPLKFRTEIWPLFEKKIRGHGKENRQEITIDSLLCNLVNCSKGKSKLTYKEKCVVFMSIGLIVMTILFFYNLFIYIMNII